MCIFKTDFWKNELFWFVCFLYCTVGGTRLLRTHFYFFVCKIRTITWRFTAFVVFSNYLWSKIITQENECRKRLIISQMLHGKLDVEMRFSLRYLWVYEYCVIIYQNFTEIDIYLCFRWPGNAVFTSKDSTRLLEDSKKPRKKKGKKEKANETNNKIKNYVKVSVYKMSWLVAFLSLQKVTINNNVNSWTYVLTIICLGYLLLFPALYSRYVLMNQSTCDCSEALHLNV